jgi:hypothetical protein
MASEALPGSFRDPSGFLFLREGVLYRHVNPAYAEDYEHLKRSGLYESLAEDGKLVRHEEASSDASTGAFRILRPERIPFVSYPYEWCFGQLKAAAELTLEIARKALGFGMCLKDASAYNIQFRGALPILIDTLSFRRLAPGEPWVAYRQFCQHFLAPLAVMAHRDARLSQLLRVYIDGLPLDLASELLPARTRLSFGLLTHLHMHARSQQRHESDAALPPSRRQMGKYGLVALLDSLQSVVSGLSWQGSGGGWADYYGHTNYSEGAREEKLRIVGGILSEAAPRTVWDLGANTGLYSEAAARAGAYTIAFDYDAAAVERHYRRCLDRKEPRILPLVLDLSNPSGGTGWANRERASLSERGPADLTLALALIHHLAIGNNVPFERIAEFLAGTGRTLVIEFVPKDDSQVQRMLATREDVFAEYTADSFERAFARHFRMVSKSPIRESGRTMYRMEQRRS